MEKQIRLGLRRLIALLLTLSTALADRQTFGAWSVALDLTPEPATDNGVRAFRDKDAVYLFRPPEPLAGRSLEAVAAATIKEIAPGQGTVRPAGRGAAEDGTALLAYSGPVVNPKTGSSIHSYLFFAKKGNETWPGSTAPALAAARREPARRWGQSL